MDTIARPHSFIVHDPIFKKEVTLPDNSVGEERAVLEKTVVILACILKRRKVISIEIGSAAEASETKSSVMKAIEMLEADWSPADNKPIIEFQRIVRNLSSNHLAFLDRWLKTKFYFKKNTATGIVAPVESNHLDLLDRWLKTELYCKKNIATGMVAPVESNHIDLLGSWSKPEFYIKKNIATGMVAPVESVKGSFESVKGLGAGDGGFVMKSAFPAMVGVFVKTVADEFISDFIRRDSIPWAKPYMDASTAGGILLIGSAIVLLEKKPWLSKIMVKFGAMAIAFSTLLPMALALPPVMALVFGLLVAFILVVTAALV